MVVPSQPRETKKKYSLCIFTSHLKLQRMLVDLFCYLWTRDGQITSPASLSDQIFSDFLISGLTVNKKNVLKNPVFWV